MNAGPWLQRLCDATPYPTETDPAALLARWAVVVSARQSILDEGKVVIGPDLAPLYAELVLRQDAWCAALAAARDQLSHQRLGIVQVRRYQRVLTAADL